MRGIHLLHPAVRARAEALIGLCTARRLPVLITDTLRTVAEQDALYGQGRTVSGAIVTNCRGSEYRSPHQWGVAFDFCRNEKGREYADPAFFRQVGELGKTIGLFWGGDFKGFTDMPHFEDTGFVPSNSTAALIRQYGTPERFLETWPPYDGNASVAAEASGRAVEASGEAGEGSGLPDDSKRPEGLYEAIERTVTNLIHDGVASDAEHWRGYLNGITTTRPEYVRTIFDRYHEKLKAV